MALPTLLKAAQLIPQAHPSDATIGQQSHAGLQAGTGFLCLALIEQAQSCGYQIASVVLNLSELLMLPVMSLAQLLQLDQGRPARPVPRVWDVGATP